MRTGMRVLIALGIALILIGGLTLALFALRAGGRLSTVTLSPTPTSTVTLSPTPTMNLISIPATATPVPTPTCEPTPTLAIALQPPQVFSTSLLNTSSQPQTYITDVCQYIRERWDSAKSAPGTVVVPIMFHTVFEGVPYRPGETYIPSEDLTRTVETARSLGFQTITALQLADFLEHNARIPRLSMIWIMDDRHPDILEQYFLPIMQENDWTITLGWPIGDTDQRKGLWKRMEDMNSTGHLDVQSHGYAHYYITDDSPEAIVRQELFGPIPVLEQHFGHKPVAFVWPGGNFSSLSVKIAHEAGYRVAFTAFARGPLMYNWIPLGKAERAVQDPLMVLPRYWARPDLPKILQRAAELGEAANAWGLKRKAGEMEYYRAVCGCDQFYLRNR